MAAPGALNLDAPLTWGARTIDAFEKLEQIGEGTYGQVFMAREKSTGDIVALKKVRMDNEKEGFPITAIREIKILKKLRHENIINLKEIVTSKAEESNRYKGSIFMVFEYMDHDLTGLSDRPGMRFTIPQIKCYMKQLLDGLHYCHVNHVLHRDIKGSNLLINNHGILKLADFGLARSYTQEAVPLTNRVITLWYRPPELLMGETKYGPEVDLWSVGCIFAELLTGKAILQGKSEIEQLGLIFQLCGTPDDQSWPGWKDLPLASKLKPDRPMKRRVREVFKHLDRHALDILDKMLVLNPSKRINAKDALLAEYFWTDPLPADPSSLPRYEPSHEYQTKKRRQQQRQQMAEEQAKRHKAAAAGAAAGGAGGGGGHPPLYPQGGRQQHSSNLPPRGAAGGGHQGGGAGGHHGYGGSGRAPGAGGGGPSRGGTGGGAGGGGGYGGERGGSGYGGYGGGGRSGAAGSSGRSALPRPPGSVPQPFAVQGPYVDIDRDYGRPPSHSMPPPPPPGQGHHHHQQQHHHHGKGQR